MTVDVVRHEPVVLYKGKGPREFRFPVMNGVGPKTDLVDATWHLYVDTASPLVTKTLGAGIAIPAPATDGIVRLTIDAADIASVISGTYEGMLSGTDAAGAENTVAVGLWLVKEAP